MKVFQNLSFGTSKSQHFDRSAYWRHLAEEANYSPLRLATRCRLSLRQFERRFKLEMGFTPSEWLRWQRLEAALVRLQGPESIKEIAHNLHYSQVSHFCRDFKLHFEMTPSESRRLAKAAPERLLTLMASTRRGGSLKSRPKSAASGKDEHLFSR